jgi:VRR-NUC domain
MKEVDIEKSITQYLRFALPRMAVSFHIPQGGFKLSPYELGMLKRAGYVAGIPDRCILWNGKAHFLECKGPRGRLSPAQEEMFVRIEDTGCEVAVVRSVDDVESWLLRWGIPINGRLKLSANDEIMLRRGSMPRADWRPNE